MEPRFLPPNSGDLITVMGVRHRVPGGSGIPPHVHTHEDEVFHVVEGAADPATIAAIAGRYGISFVS